MNQVTRIRRHLLKGNTVTQRSALLDFGIMALPRRIADLKETGFPIETTMEQNNATGQRFAMYRMKTSVEHVKELKRGAVYRLKNVKQHPFAGPLLRESDGYFTVRRLTGPLGIQIEMAGIRQFFSQKFLTDGDFEIEYVGGLS